MSEWDPHRELRDALERFRILDEQSSAIRAAQEHLAALSARGYLQELNSALEQGREIYRYNEEMRIALERAISPLPDFGQELMRAYERSASLEDALKRLNTGIAAADFIVGFEVVPEGEEPEEELEGRPSRIGEDQLKEQLVEVVPAETMSQLEQVEFVPLSLLDQILRTPELMRTLDACDFERFVATLIDYLGFEDVAITPRSGDQGRDVLAVMRVHGIPILFAFECKRYKADHPVGPETLRALLGTVMHGQTRANKGVLVTTSRFTSGARKFLLTEPTIEGKDFDGIVEWLGEYSQNPRSDSANQIRRQAAKAKRGLLSKLKQVKIEGPEDFAANLDLYLSGEKRVGDEDLR